MPSIASLVAAGLADQAVSQNHCVVPSAFATTDAPRFCALPGAADPFRHQILVGPSHLSPMVGKAITAIEFRRSADSDMFNGGAIHLDLQLSTSPLAPLETSELFANNAGSQPVSAFTGQVAVPTSPAAVGPNVPWSPDNVVKIQLSAPFAYTGGTLCIDLTGTPVAGQEVNWWMADACFESVTGSTIDLGGGCGNFGGATSQWSTVDKRSLVPGGYAHFRAFGTPYGLSIAAFGAKSPIGVPLAALGFNAQAGCDLYLSTFESLMAGLFIPDPALPARGGRSDITFKLVADPLLLGASMTTQWLDWTQQSTSNAIEWTIASSVPTLDMALVEGHPQSSEGHVSTYMAHVLRFEYQ
ncbi:MAG: hypothetical protein ACE37K_11455 [Planctomycetota bacterium]